MVSSKRFGVVKGGGAGFRPCWCRWLPNNGGFYGKLTGFVLGFKFWTVVDFCGDFRLRGLVRGAAVVVSWLGGRLSHYGSFFGRGEVCVCVCVCLLQGYYHRRLTPMVVDC